MNNYLVAEIKALAEGQFEDKILDEFILTFNKLTACSSIADYILQISTDEGLELEIGFFTSEKIADITLSKNKIYSYEYPLSLVKNLSIQEFDSKWTLAIFGEKKFDYNVVKPNSTSSLEKYKMSLDKIVARNISAARFDY